MILIDQFQSLIIWFLTLLFQSSVNQVQAFKSKPSPELWWTQCVPCWCIGWICILFKVRNDRDIPFTLILASAIVVDDVRYLVGPIRMCHARRLSCLFGFVFHMFGLYNLQLHVSKNSRSVITFGFVSPTIKGLHFLKNCLLLDFLFPPYRRFNF